MTGIPQGEKPARSAAPIRERIRHEWTREAAIAELVELARTQPKVPIDDPRVNVVGSSRGHHQYRNNFYMRFLEIDAVRQGQANVFQEAGILSANDNGIDLLAFYDAHSELCDQIVSIYRSAEPYHQLMDGYVELLLLEHRDKVIPERASEVLNTATEHPLGIDAIGMYYWDQLNPLLEHAFSYMEPLSPKASELGR